MNKTPSLIVGGIGARSLDALANGLIQDAKLADNERPGISRHVNTHELVELCELILKQTVAAPVEQEQTTGEPQGEARTTHSIPAASAMFGVLMLAGQFPSWEVVLTAADLIEAQQQQIDRLREALQAVVDCWGVGDGAKHMGGYIAEARSTLASLSAMDKEKDLGS
jgi:hypothetical protein